MQLEVLIKGLSEELNEVIIAELSVLGFNSFWESADGLRGYIDKDVFSEQKLIDLQNKYSMNYFVQQVNSATWDVALDDRFENIEISEDCIVRSSASESTLHHYQLIIDPKLAFGSGNHPSTKLCLQMQLEIDHTDKSIVDIGTGSGILSVMAEKRGAKHIDAFDNNPWAIEVMNETLQLNNSQCINAMVGEQDELELSNSYDLALGNLNASVLKEYLHDFISLIKQNGQILLSGYMVKDKETIHNIALNSGLYLIDEKEKDEWIAALFEKKN